MIDIGFFNRGELVSNLIGVLLNQSDLLIVLATAISGGLLALLFQLILHNSPNNLTYVHLRCTYLIPITLLVLAASIVAGYLLQGALLNFLPILHNVNFDDSKFLMYHDSKEIHMLQSLSLAQFLMFFSGAVTASTLVLANFRHALRQHRTKPGSVGTSAAKIREG